MKRIRTSERNTAQLIYNSFCCCFGLRTGSLVLACVNIAMSVVGVWHSLYYGRIGCSYGDCPGIRTLHYLWTGVSCLCLIMNIYLLCSLIKTYVKSITVWTVWNGFVLILRFMVFVLILSLNVDNKSVAGNVSFHFVTFFLTILSILTFLSYNQQVKLTQFGYYKRYHYPMRKFPLKIRPASQYGYVTDDEETQGIIEEEFV